MAKILRIKLLGEVLIQKEGEVIKGLPSRAAEALLIYLACNPNPVSREKLAELLWADRLPVQSLTNLRTILTALRRELGEYLVITRDALAFNFEGDYSLDVIKFERHLKDLGIPGQVKLPLTLADLEKLRLALDLYKGDFLDGFYLRDGFGFEEWSILQRERFKQLAMDGYRFMTLTCLERGLYTDGLSAVSKWVRLDPYNEEAIRAQMWLYLRTGQRGSAIQCYQTLKRKLVEDLNVQPVSATIDLYQRLRNIEIPPEIRLPSFPTNFIGRSTELAELEMLLVAPETRLITIVGPGGIGKTRLAVESARIVANKIPGRFLQGIHFVSLETLVNVQEIPARMAESISFSFQGLEPASKQLIDRLRDDERLFVLDNFEHLLNTPSGSGIAFLVEVLRQAKGVKTLLTSRERLNLYEEVVFDIQGLGLSKEGDSSQTSDAMQFFLQNAKRVRRDFSSTGSEDRHIASICRMIEGVPLAIELASVWVRQYDCERIASFIAADLDFLNSPYVDIPEKHQSLRLVFERSWSLLKPEEQTAFSQLSVFQGGFTSDAANFVTENSSIISDLIDKSLVQKQLDGRLYIHPLLHQYAAEKLSALPDFLTPALMRHTKYYLEFLSRFQDGESPQSRDAIRPERDNILACWGRAARFDDLLKELEKTVGILHAFFSVESWFHEGVKLFAEILSLISESEPDTVDGLRCELLARKARMHTQIGQMELARSDLEKALACLEHFDDLTQHSRVLDSLAITNYYAGDYVRAAELAQNSLHISEQNNNTDGIAFSLNFLGSCSKARGDYSACRAYFERSAAVYREMKDEIGAGMVLNNLGNLLQVQGDYLGAHAYYVEASDILKAQNHSHGAATTLVNAGKLALKQGQFDDARRLLEEGLEMKRKINDQRGEAIALAALGGIAVAEDDEKEAVRFLYAALGLALPSGDAQLMLDLLLVVASLKIRQGNHEFARSLLSYIATHNGTVEETRQQARELLAGLKVAELYANDKWSGEFVDDVVTEVLQTL